MTIARLAARVLPAVLLSGSALAQPLPAPVFRTGVDLVSVDVSVFDRDGRPLEGLTPDDFVLKVDGQARPVVSAQFVNLAMEPARREPLLEHYSSNAYADTGRLIMIAVDQRHIRRVGGTEALRAAGSFVDSLHPSDRVAVASLTYEGVIEFTRLHRAARVELNRLTGQQDLFQSFDFKIGLTEAKEIAEGGRRTLEMVVQRECGSTITGLFQDFARAQGDDTMDRDPCPQRIEQEARAIAHHARLETAMSLRALRSLVDRLGDLEGPKTLVLLSEGLAIDARYFDLADLAAAAQASRVTIYALKLDAPVFEAADARESPTLFQDLRMRTDGLSRIASAGRGAMFQLVGSDPRPFQRISREMSAYYLLAFEPLPGERDGRARRIQVSLASGRATVRNRPTFQLALDGPAAAVSPEDQLARLLYSPRLAMELPLSVATHIYREPGTDLLRVVVSAETEGAGRADGAGVMGFVLTNERSVIAASGVHASLGGRHAFSTLVPPGEYTLKVAALDGLRRTGSVERPFTAALPRARTLEVSDLILARVPDRDDVPIEPMVDRAPESRLLAYLEIYGSASAERAAGTAVRMEIARSDGGEALVSEAASIRRNEQGLAVARAVMLLTGLTPGRYVARAEILVDGQSVQRVVRAFRVDPDRLASR
jgi:VWFA-related protein